MATRKKRQTRKPTIPTTPEVRPGFRDPNHVQSVVLRMGKEHVKRLDELVKVNGRSRRELVEILISEASIEYREDRSARINPL